MHGAPARGAPWQVACRPMLRTRRSAEAEVASLDDWADSFAVRSRAALGCSEWEAHHLALIVAREEVGMNGLRPPTSSEAARIAAGVARWLRVARERIEAEGRSRSDG